MSVSWTEGWSEDQEAYDYSQPPDEVLYADRRANPQMVAQPGDSGPPWHGDVNTFDLWEDNVYDWAKATKVPAERRVATLLCKIPKSLRKIIGQQAIGERLTAAKWRDAVSAEHNYTLLYEKYEVAQAIYDDSTAAGERKEVRDYCVKLCRREMDIPRDEPDPPETIIQVKMKSVLGADYVPAPLEPSRAGCPVVPAGNHDVYGHICDQFGNSKFFAGQELTSNVTYLMDIIRGSQMVQPIHRYLFRLRRFLSVRRKRGENIVDYLNRFQMFRYELEHDKTINLSFPNSLITMLLFTFAEPTEHEYTILMGRIDSEPGELLDLTEEKMGTILRNLLGGRNTQSHGQAYTAEGSGVGYGDGFYQEASADWVDHDAQWASPIDHPDVGKWDKVYAALSRDGNPPLMPGEEETILDPHDGGHTQWTFDHSENTYIASEWDEDASAFKVRKKGSGKGGKNKANRRRFPRRAVKNQKQGFHQAKEAAEAFYERAAGKSGKGWFGSYVPDAEFRQKLAAKRGQKGFGKGGGKGYSGKGQGKKGGWRPPQRAHEASDWDDSYMFKATALPAGYPELKTSAKDSEYTVVDSDTVLVLPQPDGDSKIASGPHTALASSDNRYKEDAKFTTGNAVWDPGCTKAVMSEHHKRLLIKKLKENGVLDPECDHKESHTRFTFADGQGGTTKPGYKFKLKCLLNGKKVQSEWEVLRNGTTPPLFSLPQSKNLELDVSFRNSGCFVSSELLGWKRTPLREEGGHLLVDLVDHGKAYAVDITSSLGGVSNTPGAKTTLDGPSTVADEGAPVTTLDPDTSGKTLQFFDGAEVGDDSAETQSDPDVDMLAFCKQATEWRGKDISKDPTGQDSLFSTTPWDFFGVLNDSKLSWDCQDTYTQEVLQFSQSYEKDQPEKSFASRLYRNPDPVVVEGNVTADGPDVSETTVHSSGDTVEAKVPKPSPKHVPDPILGSFTPAEIMKLHLQNNHCPAGQLIRKLQNIGVSVSGLTHSKVDTILQRCDNVVCQEKRKKPPKPQGFGLIPVDVNHIVCQDTFYPSTARFEAGVQHQIDALTKLSVLTYNKVSRRGATAADANAARELWDAFYGVPKIRLTDNGPEYGVDFTDGTQRAGSAHRTTPTYAAFSNGIIERAHQKAKYLIAILADKFPQARPEEILLSVQRAMNLEVKANGKTPFEMHLGRAVRMPNTDEGVHLWEDAAEPTIRLREEMLLDARKALLEFYTDKSIRRALKARLVLQRAGVIVGSRVWYYRMGRTDKRDGWVGPAKLLAQNGRLMIVQYGSVCAIVHESRVRPYYQPLGEVEETAEINPLAAVPPQTRGRHLVQNQGDLRMEVIAQPKDEFDIGGELDVIDPPAQFAVPEVAEPESKHVPFREATPLQASPSAAVPTTPQASRTGTQYFELTGSGHQFPNIDTPDTGEWYGVDPTSPPLMGSPPGVGGEEFSPEHIPLPAGHLEGIMEDLTTSGGPGTLHPPTRHSPPRTIQMPYPSIPLPTSSRVRTAPKKYDPKTGKPGYLVTDNGGKDNSAGWLTLETIAERDNLDYAKLSAEIRNFDRTIADLHSKLWGTQHDGELNIAMDELACFVDCSADVYDDVLAAENALAVIKSRMEQEDSPMRELREDEKTKYQGLVDSARELEYNSFLKEDTFQILKKHSIPRHENGSHRRIMTSKELVQWKQHLTKVKVRLVLRGFQDDRKRSLYESVDSPTLRQDSLRMIFQVAADHDYDIWSWDLKTAFLQGFQYDKEHQLVYWNPPPSFRTYFGMADDEVCVATKSIYGLDDAPRKWYEKLATKLVGMVAEHFTKDSGGFGMKRHWLDPCLFMKHGWVLGKDPAASPKKPGTGTNSTDLTKDLGFIPNDLPTFSDIGIAGTRRRPKLDGDTCVLAVGTHVDDLIAAGNSAELKRLDEFLSVVFSVGARSRASDKEGILYRGLRIKKIGSYHVTVDMREYEMREIAPLINKSLPKRISQKMEETTLSDKGQSWYRAVVGKMIWVTCQVRVDQSCPVSQASSRLGKCTQADEVFVNRIMVDTIDNPITLHYYSLGPLTVPRIIRATCDAAFKRKDEKDDKARGGSLLCIGTRGENKTVGLVGYGTSKIHRICKSPTGAEVVTICGTGDQMDNMYHTLMWFYPTCDPTGEILTDSYSVTSSQFKYCSEVTPNLTVDFALVRGRVRDGNMTLTHQLGEYMAADGLTKATTAAQAALRNFLADNLLGEKGVEMSKIQRAVEKKLESAYAAKKMSLANLSAPYLEKLAQAANAESQGLTKMGKFFVNRLFSVE